MCGISACLTSNKQVRNDFVAQAIVWQRHRGPDHEGVWENEFVSLGHNRLSILDLSEAGSQPMISDSGRYVIVFNGEIYNHLELRKKYLQGHVFIGHSDTETILALYERQGSAMLAHLVGMWAMVIWDSRTQSLFVSRDRYGQKPLYWIIQDDVFACSSEINPLLHFLKTTTVNELAVSEYLTFGNYDHLFEQTFIKEVNSFLPAHFATISLTDLQLTPKPYWSIEETPYKERVKFGGAQANEFKKLVVEAVQSQLLSDVPIGATLSGGLDSSIIVSCIAELGIKNFPVFTAQFPDSKFDESKYVVALKKKYGDCLELNYAPVEEMSLQRDLLSSILSQEEPFGDPSIIGHKFLVRQASRAGVKVLLGGQGGDEVSMGYSWMYNRTMSYALHAGDWETYYRFIGSEDRNTANSLRMIFAGFLPVVEHTMRIKARTKQKSWLNEKFKQETPGNVLGKVNKFTDVYLESLRTVGIPHLCHYDDRSCMAQSIEGRMPFLDHRLMEYVAKLHPDSFYRAGYSKHIFRTSFRDSLPREITERKDKIGFYTPLLKLIENDKVWIQQVFQESESLVSTILTPTAIDELQNQLASGQQISMKWGLRIFRLLSLVLWFKHPEKKMSFR